MNLFEIMLKHPGERYCLEGWQSGYYVELGPDYMLYDEEGTEADWLVSHQAFSNWILWTSRPKSTITLSSNDVGKRVKLASGYIGLIIGYCEETAYPIHLTDELNFAINGAHEEDPGYNIVEILD